MSITTLDGFIAALKEFPKFYKSASATSIAYYPYTVFDLAGNPGAGTLSAGNTANGIVPTNALAGYPIINAPSGSAYLTRVGYSNTVASRISIYDRVFSCGAYAYNADTTLASQPSYSGRLPGGYYDGLELWFEAVTAFTLVPAVQVNYLDQGGNAGDTGSYAMPAAMTIRRCQQIPLASGDDGVQQITRVRCITASAGTFNINVLRKLWECRVLTAGYGGLDDLLKTGMVEIYNTSALYVLITADSTSTGSPDLQMQVASA